MVTSSTRVAQPRPYDLVAFVDTLPGELDTGSAVPLDRAAVQPTADGDEPQLAGPVPRRTR